MSVQRASIVRSLIFARRSLSMRNPVYHLLIAQRFAELSSQSFDLNIYSYSFFLRFLLASFSFFRFFFWGEGGGGWQNCLLGWPAILFKRASIYPVVIVFPVINCTFRFFAHFTFQFAWFFFCKNNVTMTKNTPFSPH